MSKAYIDSCLEGLVFSRVDTKDNFGVYAAKIGRSLENGQGNYILVFVPIHLSLLDRALITRLEWRNIQSRSIKNGYKITAQNFARRQPPVVIVENIERTQQYSKYTSTDFQDIEIVLLHDPLKKSIYQYNTKLAIMGCIETFNCVLNLIVRRQPIQTHLHTESNSTIHSNVELLHSVDNFNADSKIEYL